MGVRIRRGFLSAARQNSSVLPPKSNLQTRRDSNGMPGVLTPRLVVPQSTRIHHRNCNISIITKLYLLRCNLKKSSVGEHASLKHHGSGHLFGGKKVNVKSYAVSKARAVLAMLFFASI